MACKPWYATVVAPLAGAWIEIERERKAFQDNGVAPLAGAWIEISRERGLKFFLPPRD